MSGLHAHSPSAVHCLGRFRYKSKAEASAAGLRGSNQGLVRWQCPRCGDWHLTRRKAAA